MPQVTVNERENFNKFVENCLKKSITKKNVHRNARKYFLFLWGRKSFQNVEKLLRSVEKGEKPPAHVCRAWHMRGGRLRILLTCPEKTGRYPRDEGFFTENAKNVWNEGFWKLQKCR